MSICDLKSYEIVQSRDLSDLSSKGTLLRDCYRDGKGAAEI